MHQEDGMSGVERFVRAVEKVAGAEVVVVSLEAEGPRTGTSLVWLTSRPRHPLDHLLLLHRHQVLSHSLNVYAWHCVGRAWELGME